MVFLSWLGFALVFFIRHGAAYAAFIKVFFNVLTIYFKHHMLLFIFFQVCISGLIFVFNFYVVLRFLYSVYSFNHCFYP